LDKAREFTEILESSQNTVVLTGAGISTNAGIPDFRGPKGIYNLGKYNPQIFDIDYFLNDPEPFYDFARDFLNAFKKVKPTFAHHFLAELEEKGKIKGIITQNVDGLHHQAGSKRVYEFHGSFWKSFCINCGKIFPFEKMRNLVFLQKVPRCPDCGGLVRPDIVFFGEPVKFLKEAFSLTGESDLFVVIGSSLAVYPAAALLNAVFGKIAVINKGEVAIKYPALLEIVPSSQFIEVSGQRIEERG